jgi:transcriptional regulator with XRE-family HTH domain
LSPERPQGQGFIAFLQFTRISLKSLIPKPYDLEQKFFGEHVRRKCLKMGFTQKEVSSKLGVNPWTILNWEKGRTEPPITSIPTILKYLGYDPFPEPMTLPQRLVARRRMMGWLIKDAAEAFDVGPGTWGSWERGQMFLYCKHRALVAQVLGLSVDTLNKEMAMRWNRSHERGL